VSGLPWFKVYIAVPDHAKVVALMAALGEPLADAYVLRLWDYAARLAPSGRIEGKAAAFTLERAVRWTGASGALVEAMVDVGLLDREEEALTVHDWAKEQGAHVAKVERDRSKPDGRKNKESLQNPARDFSGSPPASLQNPSGGERRVESREEATPTPLACVREAAQVEAFVLATPAPAEPTPEDLRRLWNQNKAPEQPDWTRTGTKRAATCRARLGERPLYGAPDSWEAVIQRAARSSFLRGVVAGRDGRPFVAGPDWLLRPDSADKTLEGLYDDRSTGPPGTSAAPRRGAPIRAQDVDWTQETSGESPF